MAEIEVSPVLPREGQRVTARRRRGLLCFPAATGFTTGEELSNSVLIQP